MLEERGFQIWTQQVNFVKVKVQFLTVWKDGVNISPLWALVLKCGIVNLTFKANIWREKGKENTHRHTQKTLTGWRFQYPGKLATILLILSVSVIFLFFPVFKGVGLNYEINNTEHHTKKLSKDQLIVRRGQPFTVKVELTQPFNPDLYTLTITAETGWSVVIQWRYFLNCI